jgi:hypothetical protein
MNFSELLMDDDLNSVGTVKCNLYDTFSFAALKMEIQATELSKRSGGVCSEKALLGKRIRLTTCFCSTCFIEIILRLGEIALVTSPKKVGRNDMLFVFFSAFADVFGRRASRYPLLNMFFKHILKMNK